MDGTCRKSRTTTLLARRAASLVLAASALLFSAAPAHAADPATDFAPGTSPVTAAEEISKSYWQATPCGGQVSIVWMTLGEGTNATSTWTNPVGQYDAPEQNTSCQIAFNKALAWDWTRFCSILVHEYGHLAGRSHAEDPADIMYAFYEAPVAQCVAAAPAQPAVVPEVAPAATQPTAALPALRVAQPRAVTSSRAVKRGNLVLVREPSHKRKQHKHRGHKHHRKHGKHRRHRGGRHQHKKRHHRGKRAHRVGWLVRA